ncbi:MAG TPA: hypothetical protein VEU08_06275, partial [Vicinamibacterales bacterium]|nr:hypothetical protein [Vicinamibacterales bacterium]
VILAVLTLFLLWRCRARLIRAAAFAAPIAVSLALWFGFFHWIYGTFDPQAPYGDYAAQFVHLENIPRSVLGTLFDQKFGLLVYAPIYAMALVGLVLILREPRWRFFVLAAAATAAPFVLSSARLYMWWGGSSAPARFVVPVLPLAAPMLAAAFRSTRVIAANAWMLCVVSLVIAIAGVAGFRGLLLFSDPHGVARIVQHLEGSSPLAAALPTFTDENWRTPLLHLLPWFAAVAAAAAVAWFGFRRWSIAGLLSAEAGAVMLVAFVFAAPFPAAMKARSVANGRLSLMRAFDPQRRRAFDLARFAKMNASEWIDATKLTFDLDPSQPADELGRLTGPLSLPPGDYLATVWSDGSAPRAGDFQIALGRGQTLARVAGPLPNPVTLPFAMPIEIPLFWMQMTDRASAQAATRLVVAPASIVPASRRFAVEPRAVESAPPRPGAYFVYTDDWAFPEGGVFWTRGTGRAEVIVVPAGAPHLLLTLHIGPSPGNVRLDVDGRTTDLAMTANETRTVPIDLPAGKPYVSVAVQSSTAFRPSEVDRSSTDVRLLGCQVRVESR